MAQLVPLPTPAPDSHDLVARWRDLPPMCLDDLRRDLDDIMEPGL